LFIWVHPTGDNNPLDGLVFDGGPTGNCVSRAGCGNTTAWATSNGNYNELTNTGAVDFFSTQLGPSNNIYAGNVLGTLILDTNLIENSAASHPYNPLVGSNSNSVVYSELQSVGINVPISSTNLPILGNVGVLNYQVNGQTQLFTGWGQNLLP
jgi:hypothetical protein